MQAASCAGLLPKSPPSLRRAGSILYFAARTVRLAASTVAARGGVMGSTSALSRSRGAPAAIGLATLLTTLLALLPDAILLTPPLRALFAPAIAPLLEHAVLA
eukprot:1919431-Pleurochrysis_carterae.AAC.2